MNRNGHSVPRPVALLTFYDWDSAVGVRRLYESLRSAGFPAKVIHVGLSLRTRNAEESLLVQCLEYDTPTHYPLLSDPELDELRTVLRKMNPSLVAMSVLSADYQCCLQATGAARKACDAPIVWGGIHPTFEAESSLLESGADAVCVGEGELVIRELAELAAAGRRDFSEVPNMVTLQPDGTIRRNEVRPLIRELDEIPFIPVAPADSYDIPSNRREIAAADALGPDRDHFTPAVVMTGFGCPYKCTFCFNEPMQQMYRGRGRYVRRKSVDRTLDECRYYRDEAGKTFIAFWDDIFSLDLPWLREFARRYPKEVGLPFFCYFHPQHSARQVAQLIQDAGCCSAISGIQNGSEQFRREVYHRFESNADMIRTAHELNGRLDMCYDMIVDCPYERPEHWRANVELFLEFPHPFKITTNSMTYLPGCSITSRALRDGIITAEELTWNLGRGWDQCNYLQHRRSPSQHNHYILMNATQHEEFSRAELRQWLEDDELMEDPRELRLRVSLRLLEKTRSMMFREQQRRVTLERKMASVTLKDTPVHDQGIAPMPRGSVPPAEVNSR